MRLEIYVILREPEVKHILEKKKKKKKNIKKKKKKSKIVKLCKLSLSKFSFSSIAFTKT